MANKRPTFTQSELRLIYSGLRAWEHTGTKRRTRDIRKLLRDYVHFVLHTGCRPGTEMRNVRWCDFDEWDDGDGGYLTVHLNGKTGQRSAVAPMRLKRHLARIKSRQKVKSDYVFVLPDGTRPKDLHGAFEQFLNSIGLLYDKRTGERYCLYSLRHYYATRKLLDGVPMHVIARQMGTSTQMLERHYSHVIPQMAARELGKYHVTKQPNGHQTVRVFA